MKVNLTIWIPRWLESIFVWPVMLYRFCKYNYTFRLIYLGEGYWAKVDQDDYYRLRKYKWVVSLRSGKFYAVRIKLDRTDGGKYSSVISMHREIMNAGKGQLVDHRNLDSLDNRRGNLRIATQSENMQNRQKRKNATSQFIGVCFDKRANDWVGVVTREGKSYWLGHFDSEIEAAKAYDEKAKELFGEFARLN
ncbi:MAG: HNH endonuclease, partial [Sedimentisphaerales bacterium]|nr:HNH endonuclease [Sedimentisphaerales bacterium]